MRFDLVFSNFNGDKIWYFSFVAPHVQRFTCSDSDRMTMEIFSKHSNGFSLFSLFFLNFISVFYYLFSFYGDALLFILYALNQTKTCNQHRHRHRTSFLWFERKKCIQEWWNCTHTVRFWSIKSESRVEFMWSGTSICHKENPFKAFWLSYSSYSILRVFLHLLLEHSFFFDVFFLVKKTLEKNLEICQNKIHIWLFFVFLFHRIHWKATYIWIYPWIFQYITALIKINLWTW